jgi:poly-beta-1,6-N-acetyl-D-glucosamine synthase
MLKSAPKYVIVTPAFNEAQYIGKTIESVIRQTILPQRWVIVDDGSTDQTAQIIKQYAERYSWISYLRRSKDPSHTYYASNVYALHLGYEHVRDLSFDFVATLDADIVLGDHYYERIFERFEANQGIGIATGTLFEPINGCLKELAFDRYSTPKALQVFRRACYEKVGGYIPCRNGGEDTCTEILARMYGWRTWSFRDVHVVHQRPVGTGAGKKVLHARFRQGLADYCLATQPVFMLAKCMRRCLRERPYFLSGLARLMGFLYGYCVREERQLPKDARRYVRKEQLRRLLAYVHVGPPLWKPVQLENGDRLQTCVE